jgi:hypothetical protein
LNARITYPSCIDATQLTVVKQWRQLNGPIITSTFVTDQLSLFVPEKSLQIGASYRFEFTANFTSSNGWSADSFVVDVDAVGPPLSLFSVGNSGLIPVTLDVRLAVTLVDPADSTLPVSYQWEVLECPFRGSRNTKASDTNDEAGYLYRQVIASSAVNVTGTGNNSAALDGSRPDEGLVCQALDGSDYIFQFNNSDVQVIPAGALTNGSYALLVQATRGSRSARTLIFLNPILQSNPDVVTVSIVPELLAPKLLPQQKLILRGLINGAGDIPTGTYVRWSSLEVDAQQMLVNGSQVLTSIGNINLVLRPSSLEAGSLYRFVLGSLVSSVNIE